MFRLESTRVMDMPQTTVWDLLSDVTTPVEYHPSVIKVDLLSEQKRGVGATRVCHFTDGSSVQEEVTEANDQRMKIVLSDFTMPMMKEMYAYISATPLETDGENDSKKTLVVFDVHYSTRYGPLGYIMGSLMMKPMMKKIFRRILAGIEERLTTGMPVKKD